MQRRYTGSCHCGRVRFEVDANIDHARVCDCSMCRKRGALTFRVEADAIHVLTPLEELALYQWHTRVAKDYFCPTCGIQPFRRPRRAPEQWTINLRCLDDLDLDALPRVQVKGSELS